MEKGASERLRKAPWIITTRPWQSLYGVSIKTEADVSALPSSSSSSSDATALPPPIDNVTSGDDDGDNQAPRRLAPIEHLPRELILLIFSQLPVSSLAVVQCVSRQWYSLALTPSLWRSACLEAFASVASPAENERIMRENHSGNWRDMYLDRPHLNFHGMYVSRNTYVRPGAAEWRIRASPPVHLVAYYRYIRFMPDGWFVCRTSPEKVSKVARTLLHPPPRPARDADGSEEQEEEVGVVAASNDGAAAEEEASSSSTAAAAGVAASSSSLPQQQQQPYQRPPPPTQSRRNESPVQWGRYVLDGKRGVVYTAFRFENSKSTEIRSKMRLRSTVRGAWNRLDIERIISYDREDGTWTPMAAPQEEDVYGNDADVEQRAHSRGTAPYVFMTWEAVPNHVLNKPVEELDVFIPG